MHDKDENKDVAGNIFELFRRGHHKKRSALVNFERQSILPIFIKQIIEG